RYGVAANPMTALSRLIPFTGLLMVLSLLVPVHAEYAARFGGARSSMVRFAFAFFLPLLAAPWALAKLAGHLELDGLLALRPFIRPIVVWAFAALLAAGLLNIRSSRNSKIRETKPLLAGLATIEILLAAGLTGEYLLGSPPTLNLGGVFPTLLMIAAVAPGAWVGYSVLRNNFLELRVQRNLVYTLVGVFGLLIYLDVVRRVSSYLEWRGIVPTVVTESLLIFILVVLFEPAKKIVDSRLRAAFASEFERIQKLSAEVQECAKQSGDVQMVKRIVEERVPGELKLHRASLEFGTPGPHDGQKVFDFAIHRGDEILGTLRVEPVTSDLSGDQFAALQLLADQLASAIELCRLIGDKVQLERQLAEKAKMAFLGEMAARIAHNVKNPLSSMKTLVQLIEEDGSLPDRVRQDCRMVAGEIDRLNLNISQVLRYAKPARDVDRPADLAAVAARILSVLRAEAEQRGVRLESEVEDATMIVTGGDEAAGDIISNLVVNALEAAPSGGNIKVGLARLPDGGVECLVEDNGPGIAANHREKIFQPFFTTRAGGTGLGLAIVARRVEEIGGRVDCISPLSSQGGSRFSVQFRSAQPNHATGSGSREKQTVHG
ncbi:MAG: two-component system sensor histidine kinase NtrB, partial [Deltaproteobacteria bacterium]